MIEQDTIDTLIEPDPDLAAASTTETCPECEKKFKTRAGLASHRSQLHGVAGANASATKKPRQPRTKELTVREQVLGFYTLAADVWAIRDPVCAEALKQSAPDAARMWAELAKRHDWVAKFWSDLGGAAGWPGLLVAHMPLLMAITAHHVQPAIERRRQAVIDLEEELNGHGAFAEAPAG